MADIRFDHATVVSDLRKALADNGEHREAHLAQQPNFPVPAAGRGFSGHGAKIHAMLAQVHAQSAWRIENIENYVHATAGQFRQFRRADVVNSHNLTVLEIPGGGGSE